MLPRDIFLNLLGSVFNLDIRDTNLLTRQFAAIDNLQAEVPFYKLTYPRDFSAIPGVHKAIMKHLQETMADCSPTA
jgi:hypothetical protein